MNRRALSPSRNQYCNYCKIMGHDVSVCRKLANRVPSPHPQAFQGQKSQSPKKGNSPKRSNSPSKSNNSGSSGYKSPNKGSKQSGSGSNSKPGSRSNSPSTQKQILDVLTKLTDKLDSINVSQSN